MTSCGIHYNINIIIMHVSVLGHLSGTLLVKPFVFFNLSAVGRQCRYCWDVSPTFHLTVLGFT